MEIREEEREPAGGRPDWKHLREPSSQDDAFLLTEETGSWLDRLWLDGLTSDLVGGVKDAG